MTTEGGHRPIVLDGRSLTRAQVVDVALRGEQVAVDPAAAERVAGAAAYVRRLVDEGRNVYGVTTGFGRNASIRLEDAGAAKRLQENLIITHAVCVGEPLPEAVVRAMMLLRIHALLPGHSGIRPATLELLVGMLNAGVHPVVPEKGSVGASGDLAPLAHIVLPMLGRGEVVLDGELLPAAEGLARVGLAPVELSYKEGLALINGTQQMTAHATLALDRLENLLDVADIACALSLEAKAGRSAAYDARVFALRPHPGSVEVAAHLRRIVAGSTLVDIDPEQVRDADGRVAKSGSPQDEYSLRCAPAVHGAVREAVAHLARVVEVELNAVTDNPLLFPDDDDVLSAGNFHGMPIALALSAVKAALPVLASVSERRIALLSDAGLNDGLPMFLIDNPDGERSGLMLAQYSAAALVNELATRCHPAPAANVPTCANTEDQVSMGTNEARHVYAMLDDLEHVLTFEVLCATQGLSLRQRILAGEVWPAAKADGGTYAPGTGSAAALAHVREVVSEMTEDREVARDVDAVWELVASGSLVDAVRAAVGHAGSHPAE